MASNLEKQVKAAFVDEHFELAVDLYSQAISLNPKNAELYVDRAQANIKLSNFTEEEKIVKADDVNVELDATPEDLYLGGSLQVWREKNVTKPAPGKRCCNCRNEVYHMQIGPGMFQQMTE